MLNTKTHKGLDAKKIFSGGISSYMINSITLSEHLIYINLGLDI